MLDSENSLSSLLSLLREHAKQLQSYLLHPQNELEFTITNQADDASNLNQV